MGQLFTVMGLSAMFEHSEHTVRHRLDHAGDEVGGKILDGLFKEFTGMGFLALLVFCMIQSGGVDYLADILHIHHEEHHNPVSHTFEMVHMMIFLLLVVLLAQAGMILHISRGVAAHWGIFEDTRCFGPPPNSLESLLVKTNFLKRVPNEKASRGIDLVVKQKFHYGRTAWERLLKRMCKVHSMIMWRAIRHEFLFGDEEEAGKVPNPSMFDFKAYLNARLGHTVLGLVEVSGRVWVLSIVGLCPVVSFCMRIPSVQPVQFLIGWGLCAASTVISLILAEDVHLIAPRVPEDPRHILLLFADTNSMAMTMKRDQSKEALEAPSTLKQRRLVSMDAISYERERKKDPANLVPLPLGAPGLSNCPMDKRNVRLGVHEYLDETTRKVPGRWLSVPNYSDLLQAIGLWQAMLIASLIISGIDVLGSFEKKSTLDIVLYVLTWMEWPVMMGFVVPSFIHQLTILDSVGCRADKNAIRRVTLDTKEGLLGYQMRIAQMVSFAHREAGPSRKFGLTQVVREMNFKAGLKLADKASAQAKHGFYQLYCMWDADNNGNVEPEELWEHFVHMVDTSKLPAEEQAMEVALELVAYVDHDSRGELDWDKCRALVALATSAKHVHNVEKDLRKIHSIIDDDGNGFLTMEEFTQWLTKMSDGVTEEDISNLVFKHFGTGKPSLKPDDFVEFMLHLRCDSDATAHAHDHH